MTFPDAELGHKLPNYLLLPLILKKIQWDNFEVLKATKYLCFLRKKFE